MLRGIGLTEGAIADAHGLPDADGDLTARLCEHLGPDADRWSALTDAIAASPRGIDVPLSYWNHAPEVHLDDLLAPYGCSVRIEPARRAATLADGRIVVRLTDASGREYWTQFEYPDSPLAEDNYPALLAHVESELLADTGLTFVRLQAPPARWRFALLTRAQLDALRSRYGDRIDVFGAPLLATHQLEAFQTDDPPVPPAYEPTEDPPSARATADVGALDRGPVASFDDVEAEETDDEIVLQFDDEPETPEQIVQTVQEADAGSGSTAAATGGGVEASDDELESVFGDLSGVALEPREPDPAQPADGGGDPVSIDGGTVTDAGEDDAEPLDDLFDAIKRDVADSDPTVDETAEPRDEPSVSDLVDGTVEESPEVSAPDRATPRNREADGDATSDPADDGRDAADVTASELFEDLGDDR